MSNRALQIRRASERGRTELGWLSSRHTFSFGDYYDPSCRGFRSLLVINDDRVEPGRGFGTHGHQDMEILSLVVEGALEHRDSLGNGSVIRPGDVQRMSAGTGIQHSEFNPSPREPVRFLQIWIEPERVGLLPSYEQRSFRVDAERNTWVLVASRDGRNGSLTVNQDVDVYRAVIEAERRVEQRFAPGRHAWLQVIAGAVQVGDVGLTTGDGLALSEPGDLVVVGLGGAGDVLLFDLP